MFLSKEWQLTRACLKKNCINWVIDVVFGHSHLTTVATVTEHNKTENPINSPPGAVMMVFALLPGGTYVRI